MCKVWAWNEGEIGPPTQPASEYFKIIYDAKNFMGATANLNWAFITVMPTLAAMAAKLAEDLTDEFVGIVYLVALTLCGFATYFSMAQTNMISTRYMAVLASISKLYKFNSNNGEFLGELHKMELKDLQINEHSMLDVAQKCRSSAYGVMASFVLALVISIISLFEESIVCFSSLWPDHENLAVGLSFIFIWIVVTAILNILIVSRACPLPRAMKTGKNKIMNGIMYYVLPVYGDPPSLVDLGNFASENSSDLAG
ncbi:MAG: hypothetical protein GKS00_17880 [Alphaproteobacteria bacterium]|nr:hypothetical protein [Alphaproteobacteria bacterium]